MFHSVHIPSRAQELRSQNYFHADSVGVVPPDSRPFDSKRSCKIFEKNKHKNNQRESVHKSTKRRRKKSLIREIKKDFAARSLHSSVSTVTQVGIAFDANDGIIITIELNRE